MTPEAFIRKWRGTALSERAAAQSHFNDLCALLGEPTPAEADPSGVWYAFEKGVRKTNGRDGWADVWKRGCFAWEFKRRDGDLDAALRQLQQYALALENPPLLIVSDMDTIAIHTHFTNTVHQVHTLRLEDLADPSKRRLLKQAFGEPEALKPGLTRAALTQQAAEAFASLAQAVRSRGHAPQRVAHFLNRLLFCLFAEDMGLLPNRLFTRLLETAAGAPERFPELAGSLFQSMRAGGYFGVEHVRWFNGGLFDDADALSLAPEEIGRLLAVARLDWSAIEPAIFGTLFERGLDPDKRAQLGAHYTDAHSIQRLVEPVVLAPLRAEWTAVKAAIETLQARAPKTKAAAAKARHEAEDRYHGFLERLARFRILDPACGSGNFLYLTLLGLKDLEHQVILEAEALGLQRGFPQVGPEAVLGIEINPYAAELARVTVWIGELQWMLARGYEAGKPVLKKLENIDCRDALLNAKGGEAEWPAADVIVGNPPFLGGGKLLGELGEEYVATLRQAYAGRVPGGADLVIYWFEKARALIEAGRLQRAGLVATNSIRGGANRKVLERIRETGAIFHAWSDEPWINEGAAVRVSLVCFGLKEHGQPVMLDGQPAVEIHADLTGHREGETCGVDLTQAQPLAENAGIMFMGASKKGPLDIRSDRAREWLRLPNPHGRPNSDVLRPLWNALDVTRRPRDQWVIDFGTEMSEATAALYEAPFRYVEQRVKPVRTETRDDVVRLNWWRFGRPRIDMRTALTGLSRYIATPAVAKHRLFVWIPGSVLPDQALLVTARDDDTTFGILHSRFHELWALGLCTWLGVGNDPRYTPTTTFETFPFPDGLALNIPAAEYADNPCAQAIAEAARALVRLRNAWLNPPEWVQWEAEVVPGYPDRLIPVDEKAAAALKQRTLTNLYNQRPAWLANAHRALDEAVAAAYGWAPDLSDDEILRRLLALNRERNGLAIPRPCFSGKPLAVAVSES